MKVQKQQAIKFSIQLVVCWIGLSIVLFAWGKPIVNWCLPYFTLVINMLAPSYSADLKIVPGEQGDLIQLTAYVVKKIVIGSANTVFPGAIMTASSNLIHALVPIVILFSIVLAWPMKSWHHKIISMLLSIPLIIIILGITIPFLLAGKLEIMLLEQAAINGLEKPEPFVVTWMIFTESGGQWMLPIAAAIISIYLGKILGKKLVVGFLAFRKIKKAS